MTYKRTNIRNLVCSPWPELPLQAVLVILVALLNACSWLDSGDLGPWKEEVKLSDGRVIVVERYETFDLKTPMGDPSSAFVKEARIKIVAPSELASLPEIVMPYRPVIFDYDVANKLWFAFGVNELACYAFREGHMNQRGTINIHPNFEYRLRDGAWQYVEIGPERLGQKVNLLIKRTTIDQFDIVPLDEKSRVDSDLGLPTEYRHIEPQIGCR